MTRPSRVLITGAAGTIGGALRERLRGEYGALRLTDQRELGPARNGEEIVLTELGNLGGLLEAMRDVDAVVHLAAIADESTYDEIRRVNMDGTLNVFVAAQRMGVRRVVYASSIHAVGFHPLEETVGPQTPVRPDTYYGLSKVFGEALGRLYHDRHGMEVACLRIASFQAQPRNRRHLSTWLSPDDAARLVRACLDTPALGFRILSGISDNTRARMSREGWDDIGYHPQDDAERYAAQVEHLHGPQGDITELRHGGPFVAADYPGPSAPAAEDF